MTFTSTRRKTLLISSVTFLCFLLLTILADRLAGFFLNRSPVQTQGIIFPSESEQNYQTPEFTYTAQINALGFRDREFDTHKKVGTRIVAIGDSFTYGWGVELNQAWTKVLEANLQGRGYGVEIANLGQPGASPIKYAEIAEAAVPILKPDLIVVAVLQGDDLAQLKTLGSPATKTERQSDQRLGESLSYLQKLKYRLASVAHKLYPNFSSLVRDRALNQPLQSLWREQAQKVVEEMTTAEKSRFNNLDARIKESFLNGELNPALLQGTLDRPDYFSETFDMTKPEVRTLISEMARQFVRIKEIANAHHAEVIVISTPYKVYASLRDLESSQRLGLFLTPEMTVSDSADEAIRVACESAGIGFFDVTKEFRAKALDTRLFFELDGHFNSSGHKCFADLLTPILEKRLQIMKEHDANR